MACIAASNIAKRMVTSLSNESAWSDGWWAAARACPSPNFEFRPAGAEISLLVVHAISLPPGVYGGGEVEALFTNQLDWDAHPYFQGIRGLRVSSHFFIDRLGAMVQFVAVHDRAWHAGLSCWDGRENCNDYSVGVELEGLDGDGFTDAQYASLARLSLALRQHLPSMQTAVGHEHVAPGRKLDPGPGFDWSRYAHLVSGSGLNVVPDQAI